MGKEQVDVVRVSFRPTEAISAGTLTDLPDTTDDMLGWTELRVDIADLVSATVDVVINADPPTVDDSYKNADGSANVQNWLELLKATKNYIESRGHNVIGIAPFNEPDYSTHQGNKQDFLAIATALRNDPEFANVAIIGGNTLNNDEALPWYNVLKDQLDYGNTHQLAGSFDNYAGFFQQVTADGRKAMNDELHNIMEAMVGVEYGIDTGIFWGPAEYTRGQFVQASDGKRLGYAEFRERWTAASVYRAPTGKIQAFASGSERQATTTQFRVVVKDKPVFFDGHGPLHEYTITVPGGNGYWVNQPNAETSVDIEWGDDIRPVISGRYKIVNKDNLQLLEMASSDNAANFQTADDNNHQLQLWDVAKLAVDVGGDNIYYTLVNAESGKSPDIFNWNLDAGGDIRQWDFLNGINQQWFLQYEGNGWFSICSRYSAYCIETAGSNAQQGIPSGEDKQLWRFIPEDAQVELVAPAKPVNLQASAQAESIQLSWDDNSELDLAGYTLLRSTAADGQYETIARNIVDNTFVDHHINAGTSYFYKLRAEDKSLNYSDLSDVTSAGATGDDTLLAHFSFEQNAADNSPNKFAAAVSGDLVYGAAIEGDYAVKLNGSSQFIQLPAGIANHDQLTIATWVKWNGGEAEQRIFDFGNEASDSISLTPKSAAGPMQLKVAHAGQVQTLDSALINTGQWVHLTIVFADGKVKIYQDTMLMAETSNMSIKLQDISPVANFIGRGQDHTANFFNGSIDDLRLYNYALSESEIQAIYSQ
ncbi:LamG-like jellyroll fold domain-containing protein [Catenovulum agarivorans]|uniref:LamG-like jellyroll fold domain-containing protein n=1 Tax=Catenovulum agarivorans TaxID=1172192 RepID=UPI00031CD491|nr:LamG-like jellyroll fold domain-containing protein [Catenovulum agarivorans]